MKKNSYFSISIVMYLIILIAIFTIGYFDEDTAINFGFNEKEITDYLFVVLLPIMPFIAILWAIGFASGDGNIEFIFIAIILSVIIAIFYKILKKYYKQDNLIVITLVFIAWYGFCILLCVFMIGFGYALASV